jgi:hypothetical protein
MKIAFTALLIAFTLSAAGCREDQGLNKANLSEQSYQPSGVVSGPMVFPAASQTVFKSFGKFKDPQPPQPYHHPDSWVVYMAAPGWTNGGKPIVDRLAIDAVAIGRVKQFIQDNHLRDKVKVAWLQYDENPDPQFIEDLSTVPDNFIPLFLKPHGPQVDYYIYSPATRSGADSPRIRYDRWLKPYLPFARKEGSQYVANSEFQRIEGFNDPDGKYWNSWARHWFIVDPQGQVVDAYFSNLGKYAIQGADMPINSLIHHLHLDASTLDIPKIITTNYESLYTQPYWNQVDSEFRDQIKSTRKAQ